jgi:membrane protein
VWIPIDRRIDEAAPDTYDAVLVPAAALDTAAFHLEDEAREFARCAAQAGKPIVCMPAPTDSGTPPVGPGKRSASSLAGVLKESLHRWLDINAPRLGAALAYYTAFSAAPLLVMAVGIAGLAFRRTEVQQQLLWQVQSLVGVQGAEAIRGLLAASQKPSSGIAAAIVGLLLVLFGASGVFVELRDSLNYVWGIKTPGSGVRGMLLSRFFSFAMVLAIGFLLMVSLVISAAVAAAGKFLGGYLPISEAALHVTTLLATFLVSTALFALIYKVVPDSPIDWGDVWIGAAVTSLLFGAGKFLIGFYLGKAAVGSAYGAAGSLVAFLAWVYYSAQVFFLGAEFTHIFAHRRGSLAPREKGRRRFEIFRNGRKAPSI